MNKETGSPLMKKIAALLLTVVIAIFCIPMSSSAEAQELALSAPAAVLMEQSTGKVLYEKDSHVQRPCASITKVMTLLLTMEAIKGGTLSLDDTLYASAHASSMGGSDIWLKEGEAMGVKDLIKATVIMSANDAAVVLAEAVGGSEESFITMMNDRAKELGMADTVFKNCNGLDEDGHVTSAHDVALMSRALLEYEEIFEYSLTWIDYVRDGQTQLVNTNKLVKSYKGITGLKTGTTSKAGSCISATAERNGMGLIAVVLGCPSTDDRFKDATALLNYGFAKWTVIHPEIPVIERLPVSGGMTDSTGAQVQGTAEVLTELNGKGEVKCEVILEEALKAPVAIGQQIGSVKVLSGDTLVKELPITATEAVEEITFQRAFLYLIGKLSF